MPSRREPLALAAGEIGAGVPALGVQPEGIRSMSPASSAMRSADHTASADTSAPSVTLSRIDRPNTYGSCGTSVTSTSTSDGANVIFATDQCTAPLPDASEPAINAASVLLPNQSGRPAQRFGPPQGSAQPLDEHDVDLLPLL